MGVQARIERQGRKLTISTVIFPDGSCPAGELLASMSPAERRKFDPLFERMSEDGFIANREHFKKVEGSDGVFEFKRYQTRIFCFFGSDRVVYLLYGLTDKKTEKLKPAEVKRAEDYRQIARDGLGV